MAQLQIKCDDKQLGEHQLEGDLTVIGRSKDSALRLEDASVSRQHSQIRKEQENYIIEDLGSSNGTLVNGKEIKKHTLQPDDTIEVGKYTLIFQETPGVEDEDKTVIDMKRSAVAVSGPVFKLIITKGHDVGLEFPIEEGEAIMGRADDCGISLTDNIVSRNHTKLIREGDKVFLEDMGSQNGTFVNGKKIEEKKKLANKDVIEIGETKLKFVLEKEAKTPDKRKLLIGASVLIIGVLALVFFLPSGSQDSAHISNGKKFYEAGQWNESVAEFKQALQINPQSKEAAQWLRTASTELAVENHLNQGKKHYEAGDWVDSASQMNEVLKIRPNHEEAKKYLQMVRQQVSLEKEFDVALTYMKGAQWTNATEKLNEILSVDPLYPEAGKHLAKAKEELHCKELYDKGLEFLRQGDYSSCVKELAKIPESNSNYPDAKKYIAKAKEELKVKEYRDSGNSLYKSGDVVRAKKELNKALNLKPGNREASKLLSRMEAVAGHKKTAEQFAKQGETVRASQEWQKLLALETNPSNYFHRLAVDKQKELQPKLEKLAGKYFSEGLSHEKRGNAKEAITYYAKTLKAQPNHAEAKSHLAQLQYKLNEEARNFYEKAIIYEEWGKKSEAMENYNEILKLVPSDNPYYKKATERKKRLGKY